jgi:hypothetical protein
MLVLKLTLTPLLIGLIGLADRRWGAKVSGWLVGLPLTSAPLIAFVALELGPTFAAPMALGVVLGLIGQAMFCITYAWLSMRIGWAGSWLVGWAAFGAATIALEQIVAPLSLAFLGVLGVLVLILMMWPKTDGPVVAIPAPAWALVGRMGIAAGFIVALSSAASVLGPRVSGLLSPLPIGATIFAVFAHRLQGGKPARQILHGVIVSSFACAVFFLVVGEWIARWGLAAALGGATLAAVLTQGAMLWLVWRLTLATER